MPLNEKEQGLLIRKICAEEGFRIPAEVRAAIIESSEGVPREILVNLDTVRDVANVEDAISLIHAHVNRNTKELCQALLYQKKWPEVATILKGLTDEPERIRMAVLGYMNAVLLNGKPNDVAALIIEEFEKTFIYTGKAGLTKACYMVVK